MLYLIVNFWVNKRISEFSVLSYFWVLNGLSKIPAIDLESSTTGWAINKTNSKFLKQHIIQSFLFDVEESHWCTVNYKKEKNYNQMKDTSLIQDMETRLSISWVFIIRYAPNMYPLAWLECMFSFMNRYAPNVYSTLVL